MIKNVDTIAKQTIWTRISGLFMMYCLIDLHIYYLLLVVDSLWKGNDGRGREGGEGKAKSQREKVKQKGVAPIQNAISLEKKRGGGRGLRYGPIYIIIVKILKNM
jgi:hypothetical protein